MCRKGLLRRAYVRCGVKESRTNDDTAIIFSECECIAAATYTMNRVKAAPLYVTMEHLEDGVARAIVANAGNANACAPDGMENARRMAKAAAQLLGVAETDVAVASTGVIGQRLNITGGAYRPPTPSPRRRLSSSPSAARPAASAVSGMIHPNMGTMPTEHRDAGNTLIEWQDEEYQAFCKALNALANCRRRRRNAGYLHRKGQLAKAVVGSNLVKAAMFGADANTDYQAPFRPEYVSVAFDGGCSLRVHHCSWTQMRARTALLHGAAILLTTTLRSTVITELDS